MTNALSPWLLRSAALVGLLGAAVQDDAFAVDAASEGWTERAFRPFWSQINDEDGALRSALLLYPLFTWSADEETYRWNIFQLIRSSGRLEQAGPPDSPYDRNEDFEVWPFWFSRQSGDPDTSYRALFPIAGTLKGRLGFERLSWVLFPFYVENERSGAVTTATPWPFLRVTRGEASGFALWPIYGRQERAGVSRESFFFWPLGYSQTRQPMPDAPAGEEPRREFGVLPFYALSEGPGYKSESYLWPFFGYTKRTAPKSYDETRYFWPFLVQGRGEDRYVNRWGPFYTHSVRNGREKTWYLWPLYRRQRLTEDGLTQTKRQVAIFLYWSLEQRSASNPELASASVKHLWPFYSAWDDGAGRRQFQFPSPLEVFFPANKKMRRTWTPVFSLYRTDKLPSGEARGSILWNALAWRRASESERRVWRFLWRPFPADETQPPQTP